MRSRTFLFAATIGALLCSGCDHSETESWQILVDDPDISISTGDSPIITLPSFPGTGGNGGSGGQGSGGGPQAAPLCADNWTPLTVPTDVGYFTRLASDIVIGQIYDTTKQIKPWGVFQVGGGAVTPINDELLPLTVEYTTAARVVDSILVLGQAEKGAQIAVQRTNGVWTNFLLPADLPKDVLLVDIWGTSTNRYALLTYSAETETVSVYRSFPKPRLDTLGNGFEPTSISGDLQRLYVVGTTPADIGQASHGRMFASTDDGWNEIPMPGFVQGLNRIKPVDGQMLALGSTDQEHGLTITPDGNASEYVDIGSLTGAFSRSPSAFMVGNGLNVAAGDYFSRTAPLGQPFQIDLPFLMTSWDMEQWDGRVIVSGEEASRGVIITCAAPSP